MASEGGESLKISQIKQVVEVANTGSISQAATNLFLSQPNLSQSIRKLEEEIGTPIFRRTNTGVELTQFGMRFVASANEVLLRLQLLDDLCEMQVKARPVELSVASGGYLFFNRKLAALMSKYSGSPIEIRYFEGDGPRQMEMLQNNEIEIGFGAIWSFERRIIQRRLHNYGLEFHHLYDAVPGIYVDHDNPHFARGETVVDMKVLSQLPYITTCNRKTHTDVLLKTLYPGEDLSRLICATRSLYTEGSGAMRDFLKTTGRGL